MTREEYKDLKRKMIKRAKLEQLYVNNEIEKYIKYGLLPNLPIDSLNSSILDYLAYGTDRAKENVLLNLPNNFYDNLRKAMEGE